MSMAREDSALCYQRANVSAWWGGATSYCRERLNKHELEDRRLVWSDRESSHRGQGPNGQHVRSREEAAEDLCHCRVSVDGTC